MYARFPGTPNNRRPNARQSNTSALAWSRHSAWLGCTRRSDAVMRGKMDGIGLAKPSARKILNPDPIGDRVQRVHKRHRLAVSDPPKALPATLAEPRAAGTGLWFGGERYFNRRPTSCPYPHRIEALEEMYSCRGLRSERRKTLEVIAAQRLLVTCISAEKVAYPGLAGIELSQ